MAVKQDWAAWDEERSRFKCRDTEGFIKDLEALEWHIRALQDLCPKDQANFPVSIAMIHINSLIIQYGKFKRYLYLNS